MIVTFCIVRNQVENKYAIFEIGINVQFLFVDALVRSDLVEQIPNVAIICHEAPHLFGDVLRNYLLGIVMKYLSDLDNQASYHTMLRACVVF